MKDNSKKMIVVVEGPSGVGKDTIMNRLIATYPHLFGHVVSTTTREMRSYESQGNPYYFVDDIEFERLVKTGVIFEQTERHGTKRGMTRTAFDDILKENKIPIKDCDANGLKALKKLYGDRVFGVFITAPVELIKQRLISRGDKSEDVEVRLKNYEEHLKQSEFYDVLIENLDVNETAVNVMNAIEKHYNELK